MGSPPQSQQVLTVSQLNAQIQSVLAGQFRSVWVEGEIGDFSRPRSGHCYFSLKDDSGLIRAVMWRMSAQRLRFDLQDGLKVICRGSVDVYSPRGSYQLVVERVEPRGLGGLELALRKLREKLAAEGLFDPQRKRPLPKFPRRIAVVTSPTGAALRDFLEVLRRRWLGADVLVVPVRVQGEGSAEEIAGAIRTINRLRDDVDTLVVTRGGGSLEDLWSFNEEAVVRAICASRIPVVSAVGHEIDVTLADLAADVRALTPSEAAERVVPAEEEISHRLRLTQQRMGAALSRRAEQIRQRLEAVAGQRVFRRPLDRVHDLQRKLDELAARSDRAVRRRIDQGQQHVARLAAQLESLSPLAVLGRGFSLTRREDGLLVTRADQLSVGELIFTRLAAGECTSRVVGTTDEPSGLVADPEQIDP